MPSALLDVGKPAPVLLSVAEDLWTLFVSPTSRRVRSRWTRKGVQTGVAFLLVLCAVVVSERIHAQAAEDVLSQKEIDTLRDSAFDPTDRIAAFEQFLNDRQKRIQELVAKRHGHTDYGGDMHDALDQFGQIVDELNDNLDDYSRLHRDVRKALPKLLEAADKWTATLSAASDNEAYNVVRRLALDNVRDTREIARVLQTDLDAYFKAHPEAEKAEKKRNGDPHAVRPE